MKKYIERNGQTIKIELDYNIGGTNYFTSTVEARGYYLHVQPVVRSEISPGIFSEQYTAWTGVKKLILEVNRRSKKQQERAWELAQSEIDKLVDHVLVA